MKALDLKRRKREQQIELLRKELRLAGVDLNRFLPSWTRPKVVRTAVVEELFTTLDAQIHEGT